LKIVHVGLDLVPSSGGSVVSVRDFSHVCDSAVISFTQAAKLRCEASAIPGTIQIETSPGFWGRFFAWAPEQNRRAALEAFEGADLIVCHILLRYHVHWVRAIARQKKIPYWVVPHGCLDPYVFSYRSLVKKIWFHLFGRPFLEGASRVIYATEKEKSKSERFYRGGNRCVVNWPVEPCAVAGRAQARAEIRCRYRLPPEARILLFLGRLHPMKRPLETIAAFAQAGVPGVHLLIVGPDETIRRQDCLDLIGRLGVKNVLLAGPVYGEDKNAHLLASDGYISLSHRENFGYTTAEALSAALPVILSPGNDLADELVSSDCGWLLPDDLPETAASAIAAFAAAPDDSLRDMGGRGRSWALAQLGFEKFATQLLSAASDCLDRNDHAR
jgi:glycosyltransferase involved in cell wall biosynthesis